MRSVFQKHLRLSQSKKFFRLARPFSRSPKFCSSLASTMARKKNKDAEEKKEDESAYVDDTPHGQKKDFTKPMLPKYNPFQVESAWDSWWEKAGFYKPDESKAKDGGRFTMVIPPPNVTGSLHIGHALMCTVEDCLTRWHRMSGRATLWLPGLDHAGIATQTVVERQLQRDENKTRHDLGREKFIEQVWKWRDTYGGKINNQVRRLGSSVDWEREAFTMSPKLSKAVVEAFVRLHKKGKIYRSTRLVNWSCHLNTAIADCEVDKEDLPGRTMLTVPGHDHKVEFGVMHEFTYKFVDSEEELHIQTTRPETMLGDSGVAVHPEDKRYKHLIGRKLRHPFVDREIEIIADSILVDPEKGTGVVKVTPAHDPNDFECGRRHNLEEINILTEDGRMNENSGKYAGMMRFDCRFQILKDLEAIGQYKGKVDNAQALGFCQRSGDVIEQVLKPQWYVDCEDMAKRSTDAVRNGDLKIIPKKEEKTFFHFMDNIRPWCVSRQLWWGHRIPAYLPKIKGRPPLDSNKTDSWIVARSEEEARAEAMEKYGIAEADADTLTLEQDEDVLDTWFSSGLFPFAVFGWPEQTPDLSKYYPGTLLETGGDILFFWVCRMTMMSLALNDVLPFKEVFLHPMVRDANGKKMSKSKGNVIDPLYVINGVELNTLVDDLKNSNLPQKEIKKYEQAKKKEFPNGIPSCGADALRFGLLHYMSQGRSINLNVNVVVGYRQHCNKMWQATNFGLPKFGGCFEPPLLSDPESLVKPDSSSLADRWLLSRLADAEEKVNASFKDYEFSTGAQTLYDFWLKELCDVYLELIKPLFSRDSPGQSENDTQEQINTRHTLYTAFDRGLRLLHPFMPYISEELYQRLPGRKAEESIMVAEYPQSVSAWRHPEIERDMIIAREVAAGCRSWSMNMGCGNETIPHAYAVCATPELAAQLEPYTGYIATMANAAEVTLLSDRSDERLKKCLNTVISSKIEVFFVMTGLIDFNLQLRKLEKELKKAQPSSDKLKKKLENPKYLAKVPEDILKADKVKYEDSLKKIEKLCESIKQMEILRDESA